MDGVFSQLVMLGASGMLLTGLILLWRRGIPAYITAFRWQSWLLAAVAATVGYFGDDAALYWTAGFLVVLKGLAIPALLRAMARRLGAERVQPYVNTETSLLIAGGLVLFAYVLTRPWMGVTELPTRAGLPLAVGLLFVSLFVIVSRRKAITQLIGFLMMENAIALLAVVGTYGVPLLVELGVFLDALMGFLVMQIFVYDIHETFDSVDVDQLARLKG